MPKGDVMHVSPEGHSSADAQSWKAPVPLHEAWHEMTTLPKPPPPPPIMRPVQQTSLPVQSDLLLQDCMMKPPSPKIVDASVAPELDPLLDPELDPPLDPEPEPPELEFKPASLPVPPLFVDDPPHAAASAATAPPTKRSFAMRMELALLIRKNGPCARRAR